MTEFPEEPVSFENLKPIQPFENRSDPMKS